jgi:hypothetical protein
VSATVLLSYAPERDVLFRKVFHFILPSRTCQV